MSYEPIVFFNEASFIVKLHLHALFHDLADRDQIFRDGWNMQDIILGRFVYCHSQMGHFRYVKLGELCHLRFRHNRVNRSFSTLRTNLVRRHVIGCARVYKPYIVSSEVLVGACADIECALCLITNILV